MRTPSVLALLFLLGCSSTPLETPAPIPEASWRRVEGKPISGSLSPSAPVVLAEATTVLRSVDGGLTVGTTTGVARASLLGDDQLSPLAIVGPSSEKLQLGAVRAIARRSDRGFLVLADSGLYHDAPTGLLPSPFSPSLAGKDIRAMDVVGAGPDEAIWLTTASGMLVRRGTELVSLGGLDGPPELVIGLDAKAALYFSKGTLSEATVDSATTKTLATGLPKTTSFDRRSEGTLYIGTEGGLLVRSPSGSLSLHTLEETGKPGRSVRAVGASADGAAMLVGSDVVIFDDEGPHVVAEAKPDESKIAFDANGDVWAASPIGLRRIRYGKPVSYERDVRPFLVKACQTCHGGSGGGPTRAFDTYEVAKAQAVEMAKRIRADGRPVMPPSGALPASETRLVVRWALGGTPP
jgi:hypothetical protein